MTATPFETSAAYEARANEHKPQTPEGMAAAVKQLRAQGLTHRDISNALRISVAEVIQLEKL